MPDTYNLLINAGIAGVFAAFTIILIDRFMKFTADQTALWRDFLRSEAEQRKEIMSHAIGKLDHLDATMEELRKAVKAGNNK